MKTRAAVLNKMGMEKPYAQSAPLQITDLELDAPGRDELLVKVLAAGLCHSDLSVINGSRQRPMPMVLGHEGVGEVIALGADTKDYAVGDRVVFSFVPTCGRCEYCAQGRAALCEVGAKSNAAGELPGGGSRWHHTDLTATSDKQTESPAKLHHHLGVSAFAEMTVVSTNSVVKIDKDIPIEVAAIFGCAVLTGVGAVVNTGRISAGQSVAIFGLGGVGLAALLGARAAGANPIVAIDVQPHKLALAKSLGATHTIQSDKSVDLTAEIKSITGGGVEFAIETVGHEKVLEQAYLATRRGGTTITVGLPDPQKQLTIQAVSLVAEERTLKGSYMGSCVPSRDIPRFIAMYKAGILPVDKLLSATLKFDQINDGFDHLASGEAVRQVIVF